MPVTTEEHDDASLWHWLGVLAEAGNNRDSAGYRQALKLLDELETQRDELLQQACHSDVARDNAERQVQVVTAQRDELLTALKDVVERFGPWHDDDCPADDTCECSARPIHDAINAAIAKAEGR